LGNKIKKTVSDCRKYGSVGLGDRILVESINIVIRANRPSRLPLLRDIVRVAAEGRNIIADPFKYSTLVEDTEVLIAVR
jgi:hypothetical protein